MMLTSYNSNPTYLCAKRALGTIARRVLKLCIIYRSAEHLFIVVFIWSQRYLCFLVNNSRYENLYVTTTSKNILISNSPTKSAMKKKEVCLRQLHISDRLALTSWNRQVPYQMVKQPKSYFDQAFSFHIN